MLEGEHGEHPNAAADALHTDPFAFEIRRRTNARIDDKRAVELIDQTGDESEIESARHGADRGARSRTDVELRLPAGERRHAHLRITHVDDGRIDTMFLKNPRIARDPKYAAAFIQTAVR